MNINNILFNEFEILDVFGPIEIFGRLPVYFKVGFFSKEGGIIRSTQNVQVITEHFSNVVSKRIFY